MSSKPHNEAEDRAKQLEARKEIVRRILTKHSAESTYPDCLREFLIDCIELMGLEAVTQALDEATGTYR